MPYKPHPEGEPSVNKVILVGRLAADPDVQLTDAGQPIAALRLTTSAGERPEVHTLVTFGATARFASEHLSTGRLVYVEGRLHTHEWTTRGGDRRCMARIVASTVQALGPRTGREAEAEVEP